DFLGGKERLENSRQVILGNSGPRVGDFEDHIVAGTHLRDRRQCVTFQMQAVGADEQTPAFCHCVPCVYVEIEDHLAQLARVDADRSQTIGAAHIELYVLTDHTFKQLLRPVDDLVDVEHLRHKQLLSTKGK